MESAYQFVIFFIKTIAVLSSSAVGTGGVTSARLIVATVLRPVEFGPSALFPVAEKYA